MFGLDEFDDSRRDFENFFFSHITLIEGQLAQLRLAVERSACEPRDRVEIFIMEVSQFANTLYRDTVSSLFRLYRCLCQMILCNDINFVSWCSCLFDVAVITI